MTHLRINLKTISVNLGPGPFTTQNVMLCYSAHTVVRTTLRNRPARYLY